MKKCHHIIVVPGLSGNSLLFQTLVNSWRMFGFIPHVHDIGWKDSEQSFQPKLQRLVKQIDVLSKDGDIVSLVGTSAGGSAVLNAFCERKEKIHKVVSICGRLRVGKHVYPSFERATKNSKAFYESVRLCEANEQLLSTQDKKKFLTVRALFDEIVPPSTSTLAGAKNMQIFSIEHSVSIAAAMTLFIHPTVAFLQNHQDRSKEKST